jgi:hypothetical protein
VTDKPVIISSITGGSCAVGQVVKSISSTGAVTCVSVQRTWFAFTSPARVVNTTYTNNTGYDIEVAVATYSGASYTRCSVSIRVNAVLVDSNFVNNNIGAAKCSASATVPNGSSYVVSNTLSPLVAGENQLVNWSELR